MSDLMTTDSKLTAYQKKIESIESVILCVAEAEKMVARIGKSLIRQEDVAAMKQKRRPARWTPISYPDIE